MQIMAALLVLESALKPERLKPFWLLWAFPAPNPDLAGNARCQTRPPGRKADLLGLIDSVPGRDWRRL